MGDNELVAIALNPSSMKGIVVDATMRRYAEAKWALLKWRSRVGDELHEKAMAAIAERNKLNDAGTSWKWEVDAATRRAQELINEKEAFYAGNTQLTNALDEEMGLPTGSYNWAVWLHA